MNGLGERAAGEGRKAADRGMENLFRTEVTDTKSSEPYVNYVATPVSDAARTATGFP